MSKEENEMVTNLINAINIANYDSLVACLKKQINYLKTDIPSIMKTIDPDHWYQIGQIMKDVQIKVELLLKLCDFIEYVGVLQGMIIEDK